MLLLELLAFSLTGWLGLYLLTRNPANRPLALAGLGTIGYALAIAISRLAVEAPPAWRGPLSTTLMAAFVLPALCWLGALAWLLSRRDGAPPPSRRAWALLLAATLFFSSGLGLLVLNWLPRQWVVLSISVDFVLLGAVLAGLEAFSAREALWPDLARSLAAAAFSAALFGGWVALVAVLGPGLTFPMLVLLFGVVALALASQAFADPLQAWLDAVVLAGAPTVRRERAALRAVASALPRADAEVALLKLDEAEFARLTRRALSHLGDLARLAASPLIRLPAVTARLTPGGAGETLERAQALKDLLTESILRLKPRGKGDFGVTDEWRHYNALYFPYVAGLRPYARQDGAGALDAASEAALRWLQAEVPERTLYNWQAAAARLVAQDVRERSRAALLNGHAAAA